MKLKNIFIILIVFLSVGIGAFALDNPFGLEDATIIHGEDNVCYTSQNYFNIKTSPCKVQDIDGKDITQFIDFT